MLIQDSLRHTVTGKFTYQTAETYSNWLNISGNQLFLPLLLRLPYKHPSWQHQPQRLLPNSHPPSASTKPLYEVRIRLPHPPLLCLPLTPQPIRFPPHLPQRRRRHNLSKPKRLTIPQHIGFRPNEYFTKPAPPNRPPHNPSTGM